MPPSAPESPGRYPHRSVATLAAGQHGIVTRAQLLELGVSARQIEQRTRTGEFLRLHRGVYRVGPVEGHRSRERAATLACGPDAVLSHRSAARLWGALPGPASTRPIDVGIPAGYRRRPGLRIHRLPTLLPGDVARVDRVPVTTGARTLWDLAGAPGVSPRELKRAVAAIMDRGTARRAELDRLLDRHRGAPGSRRLRSLLDDVPALTRSEAEERLLALIRGAGLPEPRVNGSVEGFEVDFWWPNHGLVVEVDGFAYHSARGAFESDRRRDSRLVAAGIAVIRVTWRRLSREPAAVIALLARALEGPGPGGPRTGRPPRAAVRPTGPRT